MEKKDFFKMTKEEQEGFLGEATLAEIAKHHLAGRPTTHGDETGIYLLYQDGYREYIKRDEGKSHE